MNGDFSNNELNGASMTNAEVKQRLELLSIRDPWEAALLSVLLQAPRMTVERQGVFLKAAKTLGKEPDTDTINKLNNTVRELVSRALLRPIKNPNGTLLYLHGDIWSRSLLEIKLVMFELYNLIQRYGNKLVDLNGAVPELIDRLDQIHHIKIDAGLEDLVLVLAREGKETRLRVIGGLKKPKVSWNGTPEELSDKIALLSSDLGMTYSSTGNLTNQDTGSDSNAPPVDGGLQDLETSNEELEAFTTVFTEGDERKSDKVDGGIQTEETLQDEERIGSGDILGLLTQRESELKVNVDYRQSLEGE